MKKINLLIVSECQYSYLGLSSLLKESLGHYVDISSDFTVQHPNATRLALHDVSLVLFSKKSINMLGVIQDIVLFKYYSNKKIKMLLINPNQGAIRLLSLFGISIEVISINREVDGVTLKINDMLYGDDCSDIKLIRRKKLTASEIEVFFDFLRGHSLLSMASRRGTSIKTIYAQKNSVKRKLQVRSLSKFFLSR